MIFKRVYCMIVTLAVFLPPVLTAGRNKKRLSLRRENENCYFMRYSPVLRICSALTTIFAYIVSMLIMIFMDDIRDLRLWLAEGIFLMLAFTEAYVVIGTLLWEVKVEPDALTLYRFPLKAKKYKFHEITSVQYVENLQRAGAVYVGGKHWLIFYRDGKKLFRIESDMSNFELLLKRMETEKRLERGFLTEMGTEYSEWKDEFTVAETPANKLRAFFGAALGIGMFTAGILCREELKENPYCVFYYTVILLVFILEIAEFVRVMLRKVTVTYQELHVRDGIGRVSTYFLRDITGVEEKDTFIIIYVNGKKITKIYKADKHAALLFERLKGIDEQEN